MVDSRRKNEREVASLPVMIEGKDAGLTRNVSAGGIYFESPRDIAEGTSLSFMLELESPEGKLFLHCSGEVVRLENIDGRKGVAVKIVESRLEKAPEQGT